MKEIKPKRIFMLQVDVNSTHKIELNETKEGILLNGQKFEGEIIKLKEGTYKVFKSNKIFRVDVVEQQGKQIKLKINNKLLEVSVSDHIDQILDKLGMDMTTSTIVKEIKAPMPGTILEIKVKEGEEVEEGDQLLVLEAMKMENVIKSPGAGKVSRVEVNEKQNVEKNQVLVSFE